MKICGLQKLSLLDYPGKLAATVFLGGCNLRCPFCHNAGIAASPDNFPEITVEELFNFLKKRKGILDGVCVSGGEPLISDGALPLIAEIRKLGFLVKLDTNGCFPDRLKKLFDENLLDYVAMDIKNSPEKYAKTSGVKDIDIEAVKRSAKLVMNSGVDYEFRTTLVREFHTAADIEAIGKWLDGAKRYFLQNFVDSGELMTDGCHGFTKEETQALLAAAQNHFELAEIRGI